MFCTRVSKDIVINMYKKIDTYTTILIIDKVNCTLSDNIHL